MAALSDRPEGTPSTGRIPTLASSRRHLRLLLIAPCDGPGKRPQDDNGEGGVHDERHNDRDRSRADDDGVCRVLHTQVKNPAPEIRSPTSVSFHSLPSGDRRREENEVREGVARDTTECPVKRTLKGQEDDPSIWEAGQGMAGPWESETHRETDSHC
ncbi:unnamed protein product [Boreogadus saida]